MKNPKSGIEVITAATDWFEDREPVRDWRRMLEYNRTGESAAPESWGRS